MDQKVKRIGVLPSGGDTPGMNAAIRAVVRSALARGISCVGIRRGWNGLISSDFIRMDTSSVSHIINKGGTLLYTARSDEFREVAGQDKALATCKLLGLDAIVAIGGDGTFRGALDLSRRAAERGYQLQVAGIPATMLMVSGILMNIPPELYESASIDGANPVQQFVKITFPYMLQVTTPYLITNFIGNINNFGVIYFLTGGGPSTLDYYKGAGKTDLLVTWLYKLTITQKDYNLGAVIGILVFVILATLSLLTYHRTGSYKDEGAFQ